MSMTNPWILLCGGIYDGKLLHDPTCKLKYGDSFLIDGDGLLYQPDTGSEFYMVTSDGKAHPTDGRTVETYGATYLAQGLKEAK